MDFLVSHILQYATNKITEAEEMQLEYVNINCKIFGPPIRDQKGEKALLSPSFHVQCPYIYFNHENILFFMQLLEMIIYVEEGRKGA